MLEVLEVVSEDSRISNFPVKCLAPVPASSSLDSRLCTPHSSRQFQLIVTINLSPLISSPLTFYEEWLDKTWNQQRQMRPSGPIGAIVLSFPGTQERLETFFNFY